MRKRMRSWSYAFDLEDQAIHWMFVMRHREGMSWLDISRHLRADFPRDKRFANSTNVKRAYVKAWKDGKRPTPQDTPEWLYRYERDGEYPPKNARVMNEDYIPDLIFPGRGHDRRRATYKPPSDR